MSSANNFAFDDKPSAISFIYIKNSRGPSMEPWGTPALTSAQEEVWPLSTTLYFVKKLDNGFERLPDMPFFSVKYKHQNLHQMILYFMSNW